MSVVAYGDLIGIPFVYNGRSADALDCYGLVVELYRRMGIVLPDYRTPDEQAATIAALMAKGKQLWQRGEPEPGMVMLIRLGQYHWHVGLFLGDDTFIHTSESTGGVCIERLSNWHLRVEGFYRYVG